MTPFPWLPSRETGQDAAHETFTDLPRVSAREIGKRALNGNLGTLDVKRGTLLQVPLVSSDTRRYRTLVVNRLASRLVVDMVSPVTECT